MKLRLRALRRTTHFVEDGQNMTDCELALLGLGLLSLALSASVCLNVIFYIRRRPFSSRGGNTCCVQDEDSMSQDEGRYSHNPNQHQQQANPHRHHEELENPIYGNISSNRRGSAEACYEMMTMQHTRDRVKSVEPDLNYASLDLKVAKLHKKKARHQHIHAQGRGALQDEPPVHLTPPANAFLEVDADMDAQLPSRDTSTMVSHSSIYLNSQQIAQETDDMGRERSVEEESVCWEGVRRFQDGYKEREDRRDRQNYSDGSICTQLSEVEASLSDSFGNHGCSNRVQDEKHRHENRD